MLPVKRPCDPPRPHRVSGVIVARAVRHRIVTRAFCGSSRRQPCGSSQAFRRRAVAPVGAPCQGSTLAQTSLGKWEPRWGLILGGGSAPKHCSAGTDRHASRSQNSPRCPTTVEGSGGPVGVQQVTVIEIGHDCGAALKNDLHGARPPVPLARCNYCRAGLRLSLLLRLIVAWECLVFGASRIQRQQCPNHEPTQCDHDLSPHLIPIR
jgi:hypothetical protein